MPDFIIARDSDRDIPVTIIDPRTGNPFLFDDTYTLTAKVWLGDETNSLFTPTVVLDRPIGNTDPTADVLLRFVRSQTVNLAPGDYAFQAWADKGGVHQPLLGEFPATLRIAPTAGTQDTRNAWISYDALTGWHPSVDFHLDAERDQSGFLQARADATDQFKKMIYDRAKLRPGFTTRRGTTYNSIHGYEPQDYATSPPSKATILAAMDNNKLILDVASREIIARLTLAIILGGDLTNNSRTNPFTEFLASNETRKRELFECYRAPLDLNSDGAEDVLIGVDACWIGDPT